MGQSTHFELALTNMAWESFGGESIIIDFVTGAYFSLSATASDIVALANAGHGADAIAAQLAERYPTLETPLSDDVATLLARAVEVGVLKPRPAPPEASMPELAPPAETYATPSLDKFADMEEMLLLDPIHDLDDQGWPRAQEAPEQPPAQA